MSKTIWKYTLPRDGQVIEIHEYIVEVLHIAAQDGVPTLWAIVDPDRPRDGYTEIVAWGTGWPLPDDVYQECEYWGTCEDGYGYIWHYFADARFPDTHTLTTAQDYVDYDYAKIAALETTAQPYTISISCDGSDAVSALSSAKLVYDPSVTTACTGTISTNTYDNNVKIDFDKLIGMVEKYVGSSATATNASVR